MNEKKWWQTFIIEPENWAGEWWVKADHLPDIIAEAQRRERERILKIVDEVDPAVNPNPHYWGVTLCDRISKLTNE